MNYQFEIPTEDQARRVLTGRSYQAEMYRDAVACVRRLMPVTTAQERAEAHAYNVERAARLKNSDSSSRMRTRSLTLQLTTPVIASL